MYKIFECKDCTNGFRIINNIQGIYSREVCNTCNGTGLVKKEMKKDARQTTL